jgi:diguanylate cyclase (GGDEF)-like protein
MKLYLEIMPLDVSMPPSGDIVLKPAFFDSMLHARIELPGAGDPAVVDDQVQFAETFGSFGQVLGRSDPSGNPRLGSAQSGQHQNNYQPGSHKIKFSPETHPPLKERHQNVFNIESVSVWLRAINRKTGEAEHFRLKEGDFELGRATSDDPSQKLGVTHDPTLSRRHLKLRVNDQTVTVTGDQNRHPIYFLGEESQVFDMRSGQSFTSGQTVFEFSREAPSVSEPSKTFTMTVQQIDEVTEANSDAALQALLKIQPLLSQWLEPSALFKRVLPVLTPLVPGASSHQVLEVHDERLTLLAHHELRGFPTPAASRTLVNRALLTKEPVCFEWDKANVPMGPTAVAGVSWALAVPIVCPDSQFVLYSVGHEIWMPGDTGMAPAELDRALIALVAKMIEQRLEGRRAAQLELEVEAERKRRHLAETLRNLTQDLSTTLEPDELLERLSAHLSTLVAFRESYPLRRKGEHWYCRRERLKSPSIDFQPLEPVLSGPTPQEAVLQGQPLWIPLVIDGRAEGVLLLIKDREFSSRDLYLINTFASQASVALQNALLFQEITHQARHDLLTGLFNRRHFFEVAETMNQNGPLAAIILDVDHFKSFNDTHGHAVGDLVLQRVALTCREVAGGSAVLARYGGEEFVLVTSDLSGAQELAENLRSKVESTRVPTSDGLDLSVTISLGLAAGSEQLEKLLKLADDALYRAKEQGRNRLVCHTWPG